MTADRYVLCRPVAGLNDTLNQIEICRVYAAQYGRTLIVDGRFSGVLGDFGDYFQMEGDGHILKMTDAALPDLNALDCYPAEVQGRVTSIRWKLLPETEKKWAGDVETGVPLTFPFDRDHPQTLLLHQQWGGGAKSLDLIGRLTITPRLAQRVRHTIAQLPPGYNALHIRNTDYKTDVGMVLDAIRAKVAGQDLLLCTDDAAVLPVVQAGLPETRVHQITAPVFEDGRAQHSNARFSGGLVRHQVAAGSLIDLCAMAAASTLYVAVLQSRLYGDNSVFAGKSRLSGFSKLAAHLCADKSRLRRLLGDAGVGLLPRLQTGTVEVILAPQQPAP